MSSQVIIRFRGYENMNLQRIEADIAADVAELQRLRRLSTMIASADPSREFVSGGPRVQCRYSDIVDTIVDLEMKIQEEVNEYVSLEKDLREAIKTVENPIHRTFLKYRYLENMSYDEIAEKMGYSVRQIYNIRKDCTKLHLLFQ
jgi:DNA-directed RNA polymerase specialized sigma24 family protein